MGAQRRCNLLVEAVAGVGKGPWTPSHHLSPLWSPLPSSLRFGSLHPSRTLEIRAPAISILNSHQRSSLLKRGDGSPIMSESWPFGARLRSQLKMTQADGPSLAHTANQLLASARPGAGGFRQAALGAVRARSPRSAASSGAPPGRQMAAGRCGTTSAKYVALPERHALGCQVRPRPPAPPSGSLGAPVWAGGKGFSPGKSLGAE